MTSTTAAAPVAPVVTERLAVRPLGVHEVQITTGFWATWQRANRDVTTPHAFSWLERDGSVDNLRRLAPGQNGKPERRGLWFTDSDLYKAVEGVAWDLGRERSWELSALVSEMAEIIGAAQQGDGYVNSFVQAGLDERWDNLVKSHELYCIGHLIQAGIAHKRVTGSDELLAVAMRAADCVIHDFGQGRRKDIDGHPEIEMALVELYRETRRPAYLDMAQQLVDGRGHRVLDPEGHFDHAYYQDATPVRAETTVVGHAVRAIYLLAGVVDLYLETGELALLDSALRQWESMTGTKTYLTGAVGSRFEGEAFGDPYELPPDLAYGETCATIGNVMLSWRLLLATGESRFADAIERGLHNLFAASTSVGRDAFFYNNPAQRRTPRPPSSTSTRPRRAEAPGTRPVWFECACCPPNVMRMIASLGAYLATYDTRGVQLHQYVPAQLSVPVGDGAARLDVTTEYPVRGDVQVTVLETPDTAWTLSLRVPDWCSGMAANVGDEPVPQTVSHRGYLEISRTWERGDIVRVTLPMPVRLTVAHPAVDAVRGAVAVERGPLVYCLEGHDQDDGVDLNHVELVVDEPITQEVREDFLGQRTVVLTAHGMARDDRPWAGSGWAALGQEPATPCRRVQLTAIPYHLWANRGPSAMRIFLPVHASPARAGVPRPPATEGAFPLPRRTGASDL